MCDGDFTCNCSDIDSGSYATLNNTIGIGDPVPYANGYYGSGDRFDNGLKKSKNKKSKQTVNNPFDISMRPTVVYTKK